MNTQKLSKFIKNLSNEERKLILETYYPLLIREFKFSHLNDIKYAIIDNTDYTKNNRQFIDNTDCTKNIYQFINTDGKIICCREITSNPNYIPSYNYFKIVKIYDLMLCKIYDYHHPIRNADCWYFLISKYINDLHTILSQISRNTNIYKVLRKEIISYLIHPHIIDYITNNKS